MKMILTTLCLLFAAVVCQAQDFQALQQHSANLQKMAVCMEKIDQQKMEEIHQQGIELESRLDKLCTQGKRDEAQDLAMSYYEKMKDDQTVQAIKDCTEMIDEEGAKMFGGTGFGEDPGDGRVAHICDKR